MGKPTNTRHKNDNTFRFQGQKERQRSIVVNQLGSIRDWLRDDDEDEALSFLYKAMVRWQDLNLYAEFKDLLNEIGTEVKTLTQVLHQKEKIKDILMSKIEIESSGYLNALFGLLVAFVSDIRQEFVEYLPATLNKITDLMLSTTDTDALAECFDCYNKLVKDLKTTVTKDFSSYLKIFVRILGSKVKNYIVDNAAKSFSFVCSKVSKNNTSLFCKKINRVLENSRGDLENGLAQLLYYILTSDLVMKNSLSMYQLILYAKEIDGDSAKWESLVITLLGKLTAATKQFKNHEDFIPSLWQDVKKALIPELFTSSKFNYSILVLNTMFTTHNLRHNQSSTACISVQKEIANYLVANKTLYEGKPESRANVVKLVCSSLHLQLFDSVTRPLLESVVGTLDIDQLHDLDNYFQANCSEYKMIIHIFGNAFRALATSQGGAGATENVDQDQPRYSLLHWLSDLIVTMNGGVEEPLGIKQYRSNRFTGASLPCYYFKNETRERMRVGYNAGFTDILKANNVDFVLSAAKSPEVLLSDTDTYLRFFVVLQQIDLQQYPELKASAIELFNNILPHINGKIGGVGDERFSAILYLILEGFGLSCEVSELRGSNIQDLADLLVDGSVFSDTKPSSVFSVWNLKMLDLLLYLVKRESSTEKRNELLTYFGIRPHDLILKLRPNLVSGFKMVRTLTLSILHGLYTIDSTGSTEHIEKFLTTALANEVCEFDLTSLDHLGNYLTLEGCIKHITSEDADGVDQLVTMMQYILGTLFQNHTNIMQTCRDTLLPIIINKLKGKIFWNTFGSRFLALHKSQFEAPVNFVSSDAYAGFWEKVMFVTFGLLNSDSQNIGQEYKVDYARYKINMWIVVQKLGLSLPQNAQVDVLQSAYDLYKQVESKAPFIGVREDPQGKENISILPPAMEFINLYSGRHTIALDQRREIGLGILHGPKSIQKTAIAILRSISPTINDFLTKTEKIGEDNWLRTIHLKELSGPDAFFVPQDRPMFLKFILRLLLSLKAETKGDHINHVLQFLYNFSEEEVIEATNYLLGDQADWKSTPRTPGALKYLKGHLKTINKMITEWRFKFPDVVTLLMERVCDFVLFAEEDLGDGSKSNSDEENKENNVETNQTENVITKRRKAIINVGRLCILNFFNLFDKLPIHEDLIHRIFEAVIWRSTQSTVAPTGYSSDSISWLFQLMMTWSRLPRFHELFIKCKDQDSKTTLIHNLFEAFESKFLKPKPHVYAMEIVTNLGLQEPEEDLDEESAMENVQSEPIKCGESLEINIEEEQMGRKMLHHFKDRLLIVITKTTFFEDQMFLGSKTQTYIDFLRLCAQFSVSADTNHKLCSTIIRIVPKFRNKHGELIGLYNLVEELLKSSKPKNTIAIDLSHCLAWTCEKGPREALCKAIRESMVNKNHATLIQELNSYNVKVADSPDFEKRQAAFLKCTELARTSKGFKNVFFSLVTNNCFFYLRNEPDIGILSATEGLLTAIAEKIETIPKENESKAQIHTFLERVVVGRIRAGIRSKADDIFNLYLKTLSIFSGKCHEHHGALKGTHLIFQQNGKDILLELQEMQLSAKAKATNQIQHLWSVMRTQPSTVVNFVIPIMSHHLLDKTKIKVALQNLVQCSCEALKWCAIALPHGAYFKYLENVMENIPDDEQLLKQYHKLLGYILDGYHFELDEKFVQSLTSYNGLKRFQKTEEVKPTAEAGEEPKPGEENMDVDGIEEESSETAVVVTGVDPDSADSEGLVVKLNYAESKSLMKTIEERFIPKLRKYLHLEEKASHKLAKAGSDQDILVKKIPTTLAYVKLLHKLPQKVRKSHMLWVIPTLCSSLNSRLQSIRSNVRSTLMKIVEELGPEIFPEIVRYSKSYLARGYQKHVRNYTLVQILKQSKDAFSLKPNCVPVKDIVAIAEDELFGVMAEDKDVKEIVKNTPEAKGQNGLQLVFHSALFCSADSLDILLKCPIERAKSAKNLDTLKTAKSWMSEVANGLALNTRLSSEELLTFLWSQLELHGKEKAGEENKASTKSKYLEKPVDTFLLPSAKKQSAKQGKLAIPTVVSWFAYSTLYNMQKRDTFQTNATTLALLDKFARAIVGGQNDESLEIRSPTVRNLILMYQLPLKCFLDTDFVQKMWQKYFMAVNEAVSNEDINMYYKFLTSFCLTFTEYRMDRNDFSLLVKCLNKHLQDSKCTGSALVLLRNILYRNLQSSDLTALIREVKRRICSDDSIHIQEGCRAAYLVYMKNYLKGQEEFMSELYDFFKTLGFRKSHQDTHSIYKMIGSLFTIIPDSWIPEIAVNVGMDLVLALMKSQDPNSQKLVCNFCMKNLFDRMEHTEGLALLDELQTSAALPEMIPYQREICLSLNKMIEHKKCWDSEAVALKILSILSEILSPAADVVELQSKNPILKTQHRELAVFEGIKAAHRALQTLISATKLENKVSKELQKILVWIRTAYLTYKHESIQDAAVQCLNLQLGIIVEIKELPIAKKLKNSEFMAPLYSSDNLKALILEYVRIGGFFEAPEIRSNVLSGLVPLAKLAGYQESAAFHENLVKSLRGTVNLEVRKSPQETKRRETVFTFCEQYVSFVPKECLTVVQRTLMTITTRERTDQNVQDSSKGTVQLCASIQKKLEERLGKQAFLKQYEASRGTLQDKRDNNRAKKKEQVVLHMDSVMGSVMRKRKRKPKDERIDGMNMDWAKKSRRN